MASCFKSSYRFGEFDLDPSERTFWRNGKPIAVSPKAFEVLTYLVANPGRVVTKDELLKAVWPDSFVEESNLPQHISWLRKALADKSNYIVTVPGRGYQFTARVQTESPAEVFTEPPTGNVILHRVRERTHVIIDESSPTPVAAADAPNADPVSPSRVVRQAHAALAKPRFRKMVAVGSALTVLAVLAGYSGYKRLQNAPFHSPASLAVLPFTNLSGDSAKDYLSDGITEEMINSLARTEVGQLKVIARTSSMSYKNTRKSAREIALELHVQYILEGSVRSAGDHLHITTQLVRGDDQTHLWADVFDGNEDQLLGFEDRLAGSVARVLALTPSAARTADHGPASFAAHDAYLQGLYGLAQRSRPGFGNALHSFGTAIAQDPKYARAYAEIAVTYNLMGQYNWMDAAQAHNQAEAAAQQAVALDPNLAEAHAALGFNQWFYDWNPPAAESEMLRAIRLEPTNVDARHWYASVLITNGRAAEAEEQMRAALSLDPKAAILRTNLGWFHYLNRQVPRAIEEMQAVVNDNPNFVTAHYKLWWVYSATGDERRAWIELKSIAHLIFAPEDEKSMLATYERKGYAAVLRDLTIPGNRYYTQGAIDDARCMVFAGDKAAALTFLDRALKNREGWMVFVEIDPAFDSLRSDPEYSRLVREFHAAQRQSRKPVT